VNQQLHKNASVYIAGRIVSLFLTPIALIALPAYLGDKAYGQFSYWFYLISIYFVLIDMGSQPLLKRYLPELQQTKKGSVGTLYLNTQKLKLVLFILFIFSLFFINISWVTISLVVAAFIAAVSTNLADVAYAYQKMGLHSALILSRRLLRIILVPLFYFFWDMIGVLVALVSVEIITLLISVPALKLIPKKKESLDQSMKLYYKVSFMVFLGFLLSTLIGRSPLIIGKWTELDFAEIGRLALCIDLTYFMLKELVHSVSESLYPEMIRAKNRKRYSDFNKLFALNFRIVNTAAIGFMCFGIALTPTILHLLGDNYYLAISELQIFLLGLLFSCWTLIYNQQLVIMNYSKWIFINQLVGLAVLWCLIGLFYLPNPKLIVLAIALVVAVMVTALISHFAFKKLASKEMQIVLNIKLYFIKQLLISSLLASGIYFWNPDTILTCLLAALSGVSLYLLLIYYFKALPESDLQYLRRIVSLVKNRSS